VSFRRLSLLALSFAALPRVASAQAVTDPTAPSAAPTEPAPPSPTAAPAPLADAPTADPTPSAGATAAAAPPVAPAPAAPESDRTAELEARLTALESELEQLRVSTAETEMFADRFEIYGFMDMGFQRVWSGSRAASVGTGSPRALTFVLGNVNLYFDATPLTGWRGLTELRFTNYPNGFVTRTGVPALGVTEERTSTSVFDVNAPDPGWSEVKWGGVVLEQSWIQGTLNDWFSARVGYFLTPFGIWNIDHGTPTLIALSRPQFTRGRFYPDHQLGLQARGQVSEGSWTFSYVGYVSNGKTKGEVDVTDDKAFGGRLSAATTRPFSLAVGVAGYTGRFSEKVDEVDPTNTLVIRQREVTAYHQWDVGADVSLDVGDFRLRTEAAVERIEYEEGKRELVYDIPGTACPDRTLWGFYLLGGYRLPWLGLEPYLAFELYRYPTPLSEAAVIPGAGVNVHFGTEVQLKVQFADAHFFDFDGTNHALHDTTMLASRLVMSF
jgi:hypothetical protein